MKRITKGALDWAVKRYLGPFWIRRRWLKNTQFFSREQLADIQLCKLKYIIAYCYKYVPYYKSLMDENGITVSQIKSLDDISKFPVMTKQTVLQLGDSLLSTKIPKCLLYKAVTGGTTGTPLTIYRNLSSIGTEHAFIRRQWDWAGIGLRDKTAYLTWRIIASPSDKINKVYCYDPFLKELILSTYHLSLDNADQYIHAIKKYNIKALIGYPSAIEFIAEFCSMNGIELPLKAVLTSSEILSEQAEEKISTVFNCRVFDYYGSAERICSIHTCECGSCHIIPEYGYTELVPKTDSADNEFGILATGFWNTAMPLIRYDSGDSVILSDDQCNCGRTFPVVETILGRSVEVIKTPSGRRYGPTTMARVMKGAENVIQSQIIQEVLDQITIRFISNEKFDIDDMKKLKRNVYSYFNKEMNVHFEKVQELPRTERGKTQFIISKI